MGRALDCWSRGCRFDSHIGSAAQYQCKNWEGNGKLLKRCGLLSVSLTVNLLL